MGGKAITETRTHPLDIRKRRLTLRVLTDYDLLSEVDVNARVADAHEDVVEAHEQAGEEQHAGGVHAELDREHADAVIVELRLVQDDVVEEKDRVAPLEELDR